MAANAFEAYANSIRMATSTTSVLCGPFPSYADDVVITNNSDSVLWVVGSVDPNLVSAFPVINDPNGAPGQEVLPYSQVSLGFSSCLYIAGILDGTTGSGVGTMTVSAGDGL